MFAKVRFDTGFLCFSITVRIRSNSFNVLKIYVGVVLPMKCDMTTETRWGEETMTLELRTRHQELIEEGVEDPIKTLCEEFSNFPEESVRRIIRSDNEILKFEW